MMLTRKQFQEWGRVGGLTGKKTPRRKCAQCGAFVGASGKCQRCAKRKRRKRKK